MVPSSVAMQQRCRPLCGKLFRDTKGKCNIGNCSDEEKREGDKHPKGINRGRYGFPLNFNEHFSVAFILMYFSRLRVKAWP
jgi:hypothetical protein